MGKAQNRNPVQEALGQRIRRRRTELGLSQMALADRCGMHFTFVSSVERGERNISMITLLRLAEGLEVEPGVLVDGLRWTDAGS
jgi:transcriptional regulator with XRE-family HTH domain